MVNEHYDITLVSPGKPRKTIQHVGIGRKVGCSSYELFGLAVPCVPVYNFTQQTFSPRHLQGWATYNISLSQHFGFLLCLALLLLCSELCEPCVWTLSHTPRIRCPQLMYGSNLTCLVGCRYVANLTMNLSLTCGLSLNGNYHMIIK